jgi:uncharacterized membrane protein
MATDKFRRQLYQEAQQWQTDGLITAEQFQRFAARYQFDTLETAARDRFVIILISLGSLLLGLGMITFVAANWQAIPRVLKVLLLISFFVGVSTTGFYLWRQPSRLPDGREGWQQRMGQALLLLGGLVLGANLALMSQLFHQSGSPHHLFLLWALAVLVMAYSLRLPSVGILSILLMGIGYWTGIRDRYQFNEAGILDQMVNYMPLLSAVMFVPLAYWCRSRVIFGLGAIAVLSSLNQGFWDLRDIFSYNQMPGLVVALGFTLAPALLWSYDDALWLRLFRRPISDFNSNSNSDSSERPFYPIARVLTGISLAFLLYIVSFHWIWDDYLTPIPFQQQFKGLFPNAASVWWYIDLFLLLLITAVQWGFRAMPQRPGRRWGLSSTDGMMLAFLLVLGLIPFWHWTIYPIQVIATYLCNVLLFLFASYLIREAIAHGHRLQFWNGMMLLTLQILSRMLEYNTSLLFKSLAFILYGVGVILIGLWFERYVRTLNPSGEVRSQGSRVRSQGTGEF